MVSTPHATPATPAAEAATRRTGTFEAFADPQYRLYWGGTMFSSSGQWMEIIVTNWLMLELSGSPLLVGALNFARAIPMLFFGLPGGAIADRLNRKVVLVITQLALLLLYGSLLPLGLLGILEPWHLIAVAAGSGVAWAINQPARQSIISDIMPREKLGNAIALSSAAFQGSRVIGPAISGLLFLLSPLGALAAILVNYVMVIVWTVMMRIPRHEKLAGNHGDGMAGEMRDAIDYIRANPAVLGLLLLGMFPVAFGQPYQTLVPVFAQDVYRIDASGYGILMAAPGLGAFIVAICLARFSDFRHRGALVAACSVGFGACLVAYAFVTDTTLAFAILVIAGFFMIGQMATSNTLLQSTVPAGMRGRVMGVWALNRGAVPFGSLLAGALATLSGAPIAMAIMGGLTLLTAAVLVWRLPAVREMP